MRRKKKERLAHETFWAVFAAVNLGINSIEVPRHVNQVRCRYYGANDDDLERMVKQVKSINQLDLDETDITDEGMKHLIELDYLREIRLKGCRKITDIGMEYICQFKGLELLHLYGTAVTINGFDRIGELKHLNKLLVEADGKDPKLEEIFALLPKDCELIVNYKQNPPNDNAQKTR